MGPEGGGEGGDSGDGGGGLGEGGGGLGEGGGGGGDGGDWERVRRVHVAPSKHLVGEPIALESPSTEMRAVLEPSVQSVHTKGA